MEVAIDSVASKDGTTIGYRRVGQGPGLVIVHGSMSTGYNHIQLATRLADQFTVYLPDRRGRGLSGPYRPDHTISAEVADLEALLVQTGARDVFGVSFGGIVCLEAALTLPMIQRVAVYEPPLAMRNPGDTLKRFDAAMGEGNLAGALVIAMKGGQMGPRLFDVLPSWVLEPMTRRWISSMDRNGTGEYASFGGLAPTLHYESEIIVQATATMNRFGSVQNEVLLLGGSKSAPSLKTALLRLIEILPRARRIELGGVGHSASWNTDVGGKPAVLEPALRDFFGAVADGGSVTGRLHVEV